MSSRPIALVPVTLREAALDSPTFRGTVVHYAEQVDQVEKWLDGYVKATTKLCHEVSGLDEVINSFLSRTVPTNVSESILDHDYTLLAIQRFADGSKGFWGSFVTGAKKAEKTVVEPLVNFQRNELRHFKETRRVLEAAQSKYDSLLARYASQSKSKEPSSLREDAFQLWEARKSYIKTSLDFCIFAPTFRAGLDRILTRVLSDQWTEQLQLRKEGMLEAERCDGDMHRVRMWSNTTDGSESAFRRQLLMARKELEDRAKKLWQPARDLEEYASSTVPYLTSRGPSNGNTTTEGEEATREKQGWLFMRTLTGKPTRSVWLRRWFFVKSGIFGWLVQGYQNGGVEESEKIGVLLCNIKPAFQEERRFCFEVKTKDTTILLQAETQTDLTSWLAVFERAKRAAVESGNLTTSTQAFSILPPSAPAPPSEPAYITKGHDSNSANSVEPSNRSHILHLPRHIHGHREGRGSSDPDSLSFDRNLSLPPTPTTVTSRAASMDISRSSLSEAKEKTTQQEPRRLSTVGERPMSPPTGNAGGISALIAASHSALNTQPAEKSSPLEPQLVRASTLAPASLVSASSPTNLLKAAKVTSGAGTVVGAARGHRKTVSLDVDNSQANENPGGDDIYPASYPPELRLQDFHFKMLFPDSENEVLLLVFRATWSPNDRQELPGRCYVTASTFYFYSHYLGMVFTNITPLDTVMEVKAAPDKDCDYIFLYLQREEAKEAWEEEEQIIVKVFLEPIRLLQRRLHLLLKNANPRLNDNTAPLPVSDLLAKLIAMEKEVEGQGAETESWEDLGLIDVQEDMPGRKGGDDFKLEIDDNLMSNGRVKATDGKGQVKIPTSPVEWKPASTEFNKIFEREYDVSAKALFHVMYGVKSPVFSTIYHHRRANLLHLGPWKSHGGKLKREFSYDVAFLDSLGRSRKASVTDYQSIERLDEHICYIVTDFKTPWHLPYRESFMLVSTLAVTHVSKSTCKLAIWSSVVWSKAPRFSKGMVQKQALADLNVDASDLGNVVAEQLRKLGSHNRTKKAIYLFGPVVQDAPGNGPASEKAPVSAPSSNTSGPLRPIKQRSLVHLMLETALSFAESSASTVVMSIITAVTKIFEIATAHRLLLLILGLSLAANSILSSRSTVAYWNERRAANFIDHVLATPNGIMSRAVYLRDLDDMIRKGTTLSATNSSLCISKFYELGQRVDMDAHPSLTVHGFASAATRSTAIRLRLSRQRLASYRHDLIVALRTVNSLERDLIRSEWHNWLIEETSRCRHMQDVLDLQAVSEKTGGDKSAEYNSTVEEDVSAWLIEYCGSCKNEWHVVEQTGLSLEFE